MLEIENDGIEWNGVFGIIVLKSDEGSRSGEALIRIFREQLVRKETVEFAVTFSAEDGYCERREASGIVKSFQVMDGKITVLITVDKPVAIKSVKCGYE